MYFFVRMCTCCQAGRFLSLLRSVKNLPPIPLPLHYPASPLLKKTERRRSRSRSRQRIDSELLRKVDEIKMIHDTMEYLISTYGVVKDSNPLLKQSLQRSEEAAFWVRQKAGEAIVAANLEQPIKQVKQSKQALKHYRF